MNAIKSRTTKVGELHLTKEDRAHSESLTGRAPKAFRVDRLTQRATAWTQETAAPGVAGSLGKQGVRSFKLVGAGSYQHAALYVTTEAEGRERFRGTCQACGGSQVTDGVIAFHGYQRPGDGQTYGRCSGTGERPAEMCLDHTHSVIASINRQTADIRRAMAEAGEPDRYPTTKEGREAVKLRSERSHIVRSNEQFARHLQDNVLPKFGQKFTREVV